MHIRYLVVALTLAALIPQLQPRTSQQQLAVCRRNTRDIASALEIYACDFQGCYPRSLSNLIDSGHLKGIPTCPTAGSDNYSKTYQTDAQFRSYSFGCNGHYHDGPRQHCISIPRRQRRPTGFPWIDSLDSTLGPDETAK